MKNLRIIIWGILLSVLLIIGCKPRFHFQPFTESMKNGLEKAKIKPDQVQFYTSMEIKLHRIGKQIDEFDPVPKRGKIVKQGPATAFKIKPKTKMVCDSKSWGESLEMQFKLDSLRLTFNLRETNKDDSKTYELDSQNNLPWINGKYGQVLIGKDTFLIQPTPNSPNTCNAWVKIKDKSGLIKLKGKKISKKSPNQNNPPPQSSAKQ